MNYKSQKKQTKEIPRKQGGLYSIQLGQNNGPYLPKDIMPTNQRSIQLLHDNDLAQQTANILNNAENQVMSKAQSGATTLVEPEQVYDQKLKGFTNYNEKQKATIFAAENITSNSLFQSVNFVRFNQFFLKQVVEALKEGLEEYKSLIKLYKEELKRMNEKINQDNIDNIKQIQPMLRDFQNKLKDKLHDERNQNYKLQRELEELTREKLQVQQQILFCHKRIGNLEKFVGIQQNDKDQQEQEINEDEEFGEEQDESNISSQYK